MAIQITFFEGAVIAVIATAIAYLLSKGGFLKFRTQKEISKVLDSFENFSEVPLMLIENTKRWVIVKAEPLGTDMNVLRLFLQDEENLEIYKDVKIHQFNVDFSNPSFWNGIYVPIVIKESSRDDQYLQAVINSKEKEIDILKARIAKLVEKIDEINKSPDAILMNSEQIKGTRNRSRTMFGAGRTAEELDNRGDLID